MIHGDLNSGNLLVGKDNSVIFIDFASTRVGSVSADLAKLERDIVFRIPSSRRSRYYDWDDLKRWKIFIPTHNMKRVFAPRELLTCRGGIRTFARSVSLLRGIVREISPSTSEGEYLLGLLYHALLAIAHPEISIQRRTLAVSYSASIMQALSQAPRK